MTIQENENKKLTVSLSNFSAGNTPEALQKWADWALKIAAVGVIVGGTLAAPPLSLAVGGQIVLYSGVFGTMFKTIAKLFGVTVKE
jgi:hypothetical protein